MDLVLFHKEHSNYGNFIVTKAQKIEEIQSGLLELEHIPTKARVLCLMNKDEENLFNLSFRTYPMTSNGVAHILEHTVLCGSKKYPIKDPFFGMAKRSLNTFMNAFTGSDFTCYPASSMLEKDFYHLLDVYIDAVFFPRLLYLSFLQEGHRLEFLDDQLENHGIVFNEMKGAFSSVDARLFQELMTALFPHTTYGYNSGGDPKEIVQITYRQLKDFHKLYYHPSNCLFYFYGNLPIEKHLDFLEKNCLSKFTEGSSLTLPLEKTFKEPLSIEGTYPIAGYEDSAEKEFFSLGFMTCTILEQIEILALSVLEILLAGTDAGLLKKPVLESKLCKQLDIAFDTEMKQLPFMIICRSVVPGKQDALKKFIFSQLEKISTGVISENLVQGAIHQLQFSRLEITGLSYPYGLSLFFKAGLLRQHGGNAEDALQVHTLFNELKSKLESPHFFKNLIEKYFLQNTHQVSLIFKPDKNLAMQENEAEQMVLSQTLEKLTDVKKEELKAQKKALGKYQLQTDDLALLPCLSYQDIPKKSRFFPLSEKRSYQTPLFYHPTFTNQIFYFDYFFTLPQISEDRLCYLRLLMLMLTQMGTQKRSFDQQLDRLVQYTGGVSVGIDLFPQSNDFNKLNPMISLKGKALYEHKKEFFLIFQEYLTEVIFQDPERVSQLLKQHYLLLEQNLPSKALRYALHIAAKGFNKTSKISGHIWGIEYYLTLKKLFHSLDNTIEEVIHNLKQVYAQVFTLPKAFILGADERFVQEAQAEIEVLDHLKPFTEPPSLLDTSTAQSCSVAYEIASPVAYNVMALPTLPYEDEESILLTIAAEVMESELLHPKIREQNGAYGSGSVNQMMPGFFYLYSYRDPMIAQTFDIFTKSITEFSQLNFTDEILESAKLSIIQDLDSPIPPGARSVISYGREMSLCTLERRQKHRDQLLNATQKQVIEAVEKHLLSALEKQSLVVFAGDKLLQQQKGYFEEKSIVKQDL